MSDEAREAWRSCRRAAIRDLPAFQKPGQDERIDKFAIGGEEGDRTDRRIYFDREGLAELVKRAQSSLTGRCVLDFASLTIEVCRGKDGHVYEVWTFGGAPRPEGSILDELRLNRTSGR